MSCSPTRRLRARGITAKLTLLPAIETDQTSHRPSLTMDGGVIFVNPGSAGPRRFRLPISVGFLDIAEGALQALEVD